VAEELLTATIVDETPDVPMADFPVLTDAVDAIEAPVPDARPTNFPTAAARPAAPPTPGKTVAPVPNAAATSGARQAPPPARAPEPSPAGASKPAVAAPPAASKPASTSSAGETEDKDTKTLRALAAAKSIDDISNSMAETLFGEADLDMFTSALAAGGWSESDDPAATGTSAKKAADDPDGFDLFDLGPDAPLELIDDSSLPPQVGGRKLVNNR
jgi:hypothetical protein